MADEVVEKLKEAAHERWGDSWTVRQMHFSDGTTSAHAFRTHGRAEEGEVEKERLFVGADGEIYRDRIVVETEMVVDVIERDEAPEDIAGEIRHDDS